MKLKLVRWLYHHRMAWLSWVISPSLAGYVEGESLMEGWKEAMGETECVNGKLM